MPGYRASMARPGALLPRLGPAWRIAVALALAHVALSAGA